MPEFREGIGELFDGRQPNSPLRIGRVRFVLYYPPRDRISAGPGLGTIEGWGDPPNGRVEAVDADLDLTRIPLHQDLTLRFEGHAMACMLTSADGTLCGMGGWAKVGA